MTLFSDLRDSVQEILDELGEAIIIKRPTSTYDPATMTRTGTIALSQTVNGTLEAPALSDTTSPDQLTRKYARIAYVAPEVLAGTGFEPQAGDLVDAEGVTWTVAEVAIEKRQGVVILYSLGLEAA